MADFLEFTYKNTVVTFKNVANDYIVSKISSSGSFYEIELLEYLASLKLGDGIVLDVGANIGNHTVFFSKIMKRDVWAFEPFPASLEILKENIAANELSNVTLKEVALGEKKGNVEMKLDASDNPGAAYIDPESMGGSIPVATLDSFKDELPKVSLIKIDVEGFEEQVLKGAQKVIARDKPVVLCEANSLEHYEGLVPRLKKHGYKATAVFGASPMVVFAQDDNSGEDLDSAVTQLIEHKMRILKINARYRKLEQDKQPIRPFHLVVVHRYPSPTDLYSYTFVHSRVKAYRAKGERVVVFKLDNSVATETSYTYENVKVVVGSASVLKQYIGKHSISTISTHLMTEKIWGIIKPFASDIDVYVWVHGADIQHWERREFAYTSDERRAWAEERTYRLNDFWRNVFIDDSHLCHFVFISQSFLDEVQQDLNFKLNPERVSVIHNFIDTSFFFYKQKTKEDRTKILLIRPFTAVYANDLAVKAIVELSKKKFFDKLSFTIVGSGELFDETVAPLKEFKNVKLVNKFVNHDEIKKLHDKHGIFLTPTRVDTQGVSRDEAMSSGLVPITNAVAAIPEFVDDTCAMLAPAENYKKLADGIAKLYEDPKLFLTMSETASKRVHSQSGYDQTLNKELALLNGDDNLYPSLTDLKNQRKKLQNTNNDLDEQRAALDRSVGILKRQLKKAREDHRKIQHSKEYRIGALALKPIKKLYRQPLIKKVVRFAWRALTRSKTVKVIRGGTISYKQLSSPLHPTQTFKLRDPALVSQRKVKVAAIMDEFTYNSYRFECDLMQIDIDEWKSDIDTFKPDLVFVESAWRGKDEAWRGIIGKAAEPLPQLVTYCQNAGIPVVFWNKEDPAHTEYFIRAASMTDYIFTSDVRSVDTYVKSLDRRRVHMLPFASQPQLMNPIEKYEREDKVSFAGSYYAKYKTRVKNFKAIVNGVLPSKDVVIYDRNYNSDLGENYMFPKEYRGYIAGTLAFDEIDKAYKGYNYAINMNTVKNSPTMFARRVYELMASNTIVISNESEGVTRFFGDLTISSDNEDQVKRRFKALTADPSRIEKTKAIALRKVLRDHTYRDRFSYLCSVVFENYEYEGDVLPQSAIIAHAPTKAELTQIEATIQAQSHQPNTVVIVGPHQSSLDGVLSVSAEDAKKTNLKSLAPDAEYVGVLSVDDYYGEHYLLDLLLAAKYSDADTIAKAARFSLKKGSKKPKHDETITQYVEGNDVQANASLVKRTALKDDITISKLLTQRSNKTIKRSTLTTDSFGYCMGGVGLDSTHYDEVNGVLDINPGINLQQMYDETDRAIEKTRVGVKRKLFGIIGVRSSISKQKLEQ